MFQMGRLLLACLILVVLSAPSLAQLDDGYQAFKRGEHVTAFEI